MLSIDKDTRIGRVSWRQCFKKVDDGIKTSESSAAIYPAAISKKKKGNSGRWLSNNSRNNTCVAWKMTMLKD